VTGRSPPSRSSRPIECVASRGSGGVVKGAEAAQGGHVDRVGCHDLDLICRRCPRFGAGLIQRDLDLLVEIVEEASDQVAEGVDGSQCSGTSSGPVRGKRRVDGVDVNDARS